MQLYPRSGALPDVSYSKQSNTYKHVHSLEIQILRYASFMFDFSHTMPEPSIKMDVASDPFLYEIDRV